MKLVIEILTNGYAELCAKMLAFAEPHEAEQVIDIVRNILNYLVLSETSGTLGRVSKSCKFFL